MHSFNIADENTDVSELFVLFEQAVSESPFQDVYTSKDGLYSALCSYCVSDPEEHIMFLYKVDDKVVGFLCADVGYYSRLKQPSKFASETLWYVHPDYRGRHSLELMSLFEKWAIYIKADFISVSSQVNGLEEKVGRIYEHRGFKKTEEHYIKRLTY